MNALIVATSATPPDAEQAIAEHRRQRIDYIDLAQRMGAAYVDYNRTGVGRPALRRIESLLRIDLHQARAVANVVRKQHYNIVISMSERVGIPLTLLLPRNVKHIVHWHHPLSRHKLKILTALRVPQHWDRIIVYTQAEADTLRSKLKLGRDRIIPVRYPVDSNFYQPIPTTTTGPIMSVGLSHRDYPTLMRALHNLPDIRCDIYAASSWIKSGSGANEQTLPINVRMHSYVQPLELRQRYAECAFVVTPINASTQWSAGVNGVLEAQAMGKAVITMQTPGMAEYVRNGETGMLVPPGDHQALSEAIKFLWENPQRAAEMGAAGRIWVENNFELGRCLEEVVTVAEHIQSPDTIERVAKPISN